MLARSTALGAFWLMFQGVGARVIGFLSQIVLARLLAPADFGILGLAMTVTAVVGLVATFGIDDVLMQRQRTIHRWTTPAFGTAVGLGIAAFLFICLISPLAAGFYNSPALTIMLPIMALAMPIGALSMVPSVMLRASLRFKTLAKLNILEQMLVQALTIYFAWRGYGALSFAVPLPIAAALRAGVQWVLVRPRFGKARRGQRAYMFRKGATVFGSRLITAGVHQGDYALLGVLTTPAIVGVYFFAFRLAVQPIHMLAGSFQTVLFPALAQLQGHPDRQRDAAVNASRILAAAVMPYCFLQAAIAEPAVALLFGRKWAAAVPLIQILSIGLAFDAVSWVAGALLSARGEFSRALRYSIGFMPIFFIAITVGAVASSAIGVAVGVSVFYVLLGPVFTYLVFRTYGITPRQVSAIYVVPAVVSGIGMSVALLAEYSLGVEVHLLLRILIIGVVGPCAYALLLKLVAPSLFGQVLGQILSISRRKSGTLQPAPLR
ncbi:MAG: polysaccharide biosynthesis protein [Sphingomonas bacterium]|nr:polysaccharide biosynthesis protein [Sphingomonas bacterium]